MIWRFIIVFLCVIQLSEEQIPPANVHQTRQTLFGLSQQAFPAPNKWLSSLPSQSSYGNYVPSFGQIMGNVISPSTSVSMSSESKSGEPVPKLSPQQRAQARDGLDAGMDIAEIAILQNYPVHLLEQLEESLTEPSTAGNSLPSNNMKQNMLNNPVRNLVGNAGNILSKPVRNLVGNAGNILSNPVRNLVGNAGNILSNPVHNLVGNAGDILSNPFRNLVGNAGNINWPGNNFPLNKVSQVWINNNPVGNSIQNRLQAYQQTMNTGLTDAQSPVSNTDTPLLANTPPQNVVAEHNRVSQIPKRKQSNYVDPSVVSILMALSRMWDKRQNQGYIGSLEEKIAFHQIDRIIRTLSPESKRIIVPIIQRFNLLNSMHQTLPQKDRNVVPPTDKHGRTESKTPNKPASVPVNNNTLSPEGTVQHSTNFTTGENSTSSVGLSYISTVSQITQLEKPSTSIENPGSKLELPSTGLDPRPAEISSLPLSGNKDHLNHTSLFNSNLPGTSKAETSRNLSQFGSLQSINESSHLLYSPAAPIMLHDELPNVLGLDAINSNAVPKDLVNHQTPFQANNIGDPRVTVPKASLPDSNTKESIRNAYLSKVPPNGANTNDALSSSGAGQSLKTLQEQPLDIVNAGALLPSEVNITSDPVTQVEQSHVPTPSDTIEVTQAIYNTTKMDSVVPENRLSIDTSELKSPETTHTNSIASSHSVHGSTSTVNQAPPAITDKTNTTSGSLLSDVSKRNSPKSSGTTHTRGKAFISTNNFNKTKSPDKTITSNSVPDNNALTSVISTRVESSSFSDLKDNTKAAGVDKTIDKRIRSTIQLTKREMASARLVEHKVIQATWKALSKSLKDMTAYGNLLLALTHNLVK